ncbi:MAG: ABC transporter permease, partial [Bacteroidales bacterium]|nr:ABC transporter permease [Bacteroidales bacterium]
MDTLYNIKWSLKQLKKYPLQSIINIFGLAIGLTIFMLIALYINYHYTVDKFHDKINNLYRIENSGSAITPATYTPFLKQEINGINAISRIAFHEGYVNYKNSTGSKTQTIKTFVYANKDFLDIFSYPVIQGNIDDVANTPKAILLTKSIAEKLFNNENPINKTVSYSCSYQDDITMYIVKGIIDDIPENSSLQFDAVTFDTPDIKIAENPDIANNWNYSMCETVLELTPDVSIEEIEKKIEVAITKKIIDLGVRDKNYKANLSLLPYKDIYFSKNSDLHEKKGNKKYIYIFLTVAIFVLIIACINYVNITTSLIASRLKSFGILKISGAGKNNITKLVLVDGIVVAFGATILSVVFVEFLLPFFRKLIAINIQIPYSFVLIAGVLVVLPVILGLIAALYPMFYLKRFNLTKVLKGEAIKGKSGGVFRKILIVIQFTISVFLIIGTIIIKNQMNYVQNFDPGYSTKQIIEVSMSPEIKKHYNVFKEKLITNANILGLTRSDFPIDNAGSSNGIKKGRGKENYLQIFSFSVDKDFFSFFDIEFIGGRNFSETDLQLNHVPYIVNKKVANWYGSIDTTLIAKIHEGDIVGVVNNFNVKNLHQGIQPAIFRLEPLQTYMFYIKINAKNYRSAISYIDKIWNEMSPNYPFEYKFMDDTFEKTYRTEIQFGKLFLIFSFISIFIACIGLFAMSSFIALKRTKEIGIRKSHGASIPQIILLLSKDLSIWVLIANIIAIPVAYYYMKNWLNTFAYKTELSWWIFVVAILMSLVIALTTIFYHTIKTARKNPIES